MTANQNQPSDGYISGSQSTMRGVGMQGTVTRGDGMSTHDFSEAVERLVPERSPSVDVCL